MQKGPRLPKKLLDSCVRLVSRLSKRAVRGTYGKVKSSEPENLEDEDIVLARLGANVGKGMAISKNEDE